MYLAIKKIGENELIINKSRFICTINRAETEEDAINFIKQMKKKYHDANHNCSAYIVGKNALRQKANDDGEPSGTAGVPMLEVLKKNNLKDTVCVVTRYFGGIKLGAGGLIRAYGSSVSEAIKKVGIIQKKQMQKVDVIFDYSQIGLIDSKLINYKILDKTFLEKVTYEFLIGSEEVQNFLEYIIDVTNDNIKYQLKEITLSEIDFQK